MSSTVSEHDGRHDFDFLHGSWRIRNERLVERFVGSIEWETFDALGVVRPILGGTGNLDEYATDHWPGFEALSLRVFSPATRLWSIHWADTRAGALLPPTVGRFEGGRGDFYGKEVIDGRDVTVHFVWANVDTPNPTWIQEFSVDGGDTWEVNWHMAFTRIDDEQSERSAIRDTADAVAAVPGGDGIPLDASSIDDAPIMRDRSDEESAPTDEAQGRLAGAAAAVLGAA